MAVWTVNTTADDGSVDTTNHVGSLRGCIGAAANDDSIVFDSSLEEGGVITIYVDSTININKNVTISGVSSGRVCIDGQSAYKIAATTAVVSPTFNYMTFQNAALTGYSGGAVYSISVANGDATTTFNKCVFKDSTAQRYGILYAGGSGNAVIIFNSCVFSNLSTTIAGGNISVREKGGVYFNNCEFSNNTATNGAAFANYGTGTIAIDNCVINDTTSNYNIYINSGGALVINGKTSVDKVDFINATITFSGVDSILAVTTTATIGAATFTAAANSTGYAAFPTGTDVTSATFTGVKTATYGATTAVSATVDKRIVSVTVTPSSSPLVEYKSVGGSTWNTLELTNGSGTITDDRSFKVRTFDGSFVESATVPRTYYYQGSASSGSFQTPADWAMDEDKTMTCNAVPTIAGSTFNL